jgi:hypothetical protein
MAIVLLQFSRSPELFSSMINLPYRIANNSQDSNLVHSSPLRETLSTRLNCWTLLPDLCGSVLETARDFSDCQKRQNLKSPGGTPLPSACILTWP